MLEAYAIYKKDVYLASARKGGDFMLLAQMPEPQPVWAQQYNVQMEPAWARKFEPPSVVSSESLGVLTALMDLYVDTGEKKYLEPIPAALAWFKRSRLPDGKTARFYELKTNKPLYFTKNYELTYSDADMPTHYSFKSALGVERYEERYQELTKTDRATLLAKRTDASRKSHSSAAYEKTVRQVIDRLDAEGRWVDQGWILSATFNRNMQVLANYLAATK